MKKKNLAALLFACTLAACGGGSSGSGASSPAFATGAAGQPAIAETQAGSTSNAKAAARQKTVTAHLANEGEIFTLPVAGAVRFGSGNNWTASRPTPANVPTMCHIDVFGNPGVPAPRVCETVTEVADEVPAQSGTRLADEGAIFTVPVETLVRFGSGNSWTGWRMVPANVRTMCHIDVFGNPGIPAPRVCEAAASTAAPTDTAHVANEGQVMTLPVETLVRFGSGNNWTGWRPVPANVPTMCHIDVFGNPGVGAPRTCEAMSGAVAPAPVQIANEGVVFTVPVDTLVRFGSGNSWTGWRKVPANVRTMCHVDVFGNPGVAAPRVCEAAGAPASPVPAPAPVGTVHVADEGEVFALAADTVVLFGRGSHWVERSVAANVRTMCHSDIFGDPGVSAPRVCESVPETPMPPAAPPESFPIEPAPAPMQTGPVLPGDVVDASGKIVASAYASMAGAMSKPAGLAYRYGPNAGAYGAGGGVQLFGPRPNNRFPEYPYIWQIGARTGNVGLFSSNQANVTFLADNPANVGVTDFQTTTHMYNTFAFLPQLSWTHYGSGLDSVNVSAYKAAGVVSGDPVAVTRCAGRPGYCASGVTAFQNGVIATVGSNTAVNKATVRLPSHKVPTGIAMTNQSEFALVTVWDTIALKGQVAVVALAGLCDRCHPYNNKANGSYGDWYDWWQEWMGVYPGLPNMGNIAFMKILGFIDLVASDGSAMAAPTEIAVTTGLDPFDTMLPDGGGFMGYLYPLTNQANRQAFLDGSLSSRYAKGGMAVVISKSEKKAAFIDLKPLFSYVNGVYFGGDVNTFKLRMASLGQADSQWPYTFADQPQQKPTVVKMLALADKPTAVKTTVYGATQRAWIATQDGSLRVYNLGGYAPGFTVTTPTSTSIAELPQFAINVGRNPTSLGISKGQPETPHLDYPDPNRQVLVNSRGDRKISWVRFDANGSSIVRVLQDPRMQDPIAIEDTDNFANMGYVLAVADHDGKAVHSFRYGPVIFVDGGSCPKSSGGCPVVPTGATSIEYGGMMALPGKPFHVSGANVP